VTYPTIQLPSGMHGRSCAIRVIVRFGLCAPRHRISSASDQRSRTAPVGSLQIGTRTSERPFALLKRLPASGPPFQGQCSWPIPSAQCSDFAGPVRPLRSSTPPRLAPDGANSPRCDPLPGSLCASPTVFQLSTPAWGFYAPPDQSVQADYQPRGSPNRNARFPSLPATCIF